MMNSSIADRLAAARHGRFVGRRSELELFHLALTADEPAFLVLHIYGPGGVGKTALLRQFERMAVENGRSVIRIDGRHLDPSPANFLLALSTVVSNVAQRPLREQLSVISEPVADQRSLITDHRILITDPTVLFVDTYETITVLDTWLRETLLPQLPAQTLIVIAGRQKPAPAWHSDWGDLVRIISLRNLPPEDGRSYLVTRNIPPDQHDNVLNFTHGHPLALSLVADVLHQIETPFAPQTDPDVVRTLLDRFIHDIPEAGHRLALEACAVAWSLSESLLAAVLGDEAAPEAFQWLRQLSFIEQGPYGLFPHDLARDVIEADLHWRNPQTYRHLQKKLLLGLYAQFKRSNSFGQQRTRLDLLYVNRRKPFLAPFFDWEAMDRAYVEPITAADVPLIVDMVRQHEGEASAGIVAHWLRCQPEAFQVCRTGSNEVIGFMTLLALHQSTPEDATVDPAVSAMLTFVEQHGPLRPGEEIVCLRFWMDREKYQAVTPVINLTAANNVSYWLTHPKLAWNFIVMADPDFWLPHFTGIRMPRVPEADFVVGERTYSVFAHDWRVEPGDAWQFNIHLADEKPLAKPVAQMTPSLVLSQSEFAEAVRQALRDFTRPDLLVNNPLLRSKVVLEAADLADPIATLQSLLQQAVLSLKANPKDAKFHRALWHTYIEPAPTQERAAERLDLPFNTYRYHLSNGLDRVTAWLWQKEVQ
jgi:hypothetical protein